MNASRASALLPWLPAAGWTAVMCYFMLAPGSGTAAEDVSAAFGGTDLTDAIGHVGLTLVNTVLLSYALRTLLPQPRAVTLAAGFTLVFSISLEIAQRWVPDRGSTLFDALANAAGVALAVAFLNWRANRESRSAA